MPNVPTLIQQLVERFDRNIGAYKSPAYNETELRVEFVNPFWKSLGWDMTNEAGYAMVYRDVVHEDAIKVGTATKAPDYCFRIGGMRKFFLETKSPAHNLKEDPSPAFQLRRYGWSAKLPMSILTDFEEMIVYDCRIRPKKTDKAAQARVKYVRYTEYADRWDEIESVFSREAVLKGSFDKFTETTKGKRGAAEVDTEFLKKIESWRNVLAKNIALRNPCLNVRELNFAVQMTIDRIIFLRMCEDRGIEKYGQLQALCGGNRIYQRLIGIYQKADERYNSGLFHFQPEKDRDSLPDELTPKLKLDDKVLKGIFQHLYYPDSPYEFRILPPEILGNVYEQFLGKVIKLTAGHHAKVEEKPEVRKAGGVYYTPKYIVDYIVKNTIGKLLTPDSRPLTPARASRLRILDPACGSGSFLIGAYQYLLDWHLKYYLDQMDKTGKVPTIQPKAGKKRKKSDAPVMFQGRGGDYLLTTVEKKRILLNNIYGVDIDTQAVEVTKLSLLLKVLENENQDTLQSQLSLWRERALPDLSSNIKCGNSLIGPDFFHGKQMHLFDEEAKYRINAFDWNDDKHGFGEIMRAGGPDRRSLGKGGFDAVIGNPPWGADFSDDELQYLRTSYRDIIVRMIDSYMYFIHRSSSLMSRAGAFGMIIPSTLLTQSDAQLLRHFILEGFEIQSLVNLGEKVFGPKVLNTSTVLTYVGHDCKADDGLVTVADLRHLAPEEKARELQQLHKTKRKDWVNIVTSSAASTYYTLNLPAVSLLQKLSTTFARFKDLIEGSIQRGISPDYAEAFVVENKTAREERIEDNVLRPVVLGRHISRYGVLNSDTSIIYLTRKDDIHQYPNARVHLDTYRHKITCREVKEGKHPWFALHRPRDPDIFRSPKFIGLTTTRKICIALDEAADYYATDALYLFRIKQSLRIPERFVLGVLHSSCFQFLYQTHCQGEQRVIPQIKAAKLYDLPFPVIETDSLNGKSGRDRMVVLVESMLDLNKKLQAAKTPNEKTRLERQISSTDKQIDTLVYELYGLTDDEIKIVEAGA